MKITLQLRFVFARYCDVFVSRHNCVIIYLFNIVTLFDNVRTTLYCGTFEFSVKITLQLRYVFARLCNVILLCQNDVVLLCQAYIIYWFEVKRFLITLELLYILTRLNYLWE